jgi:hypothetical protein
VTVAACRRSSKLSLLLRLQRSSCFPLASCLLLCCRCLANNRICYSNRGPNRRHSPFHRPLRLSLPHCSLCSSLHPPINYRHWICFYISPPADAQLWASTSHSMPRRQFVADLQRAIESGPTAGLSNIQSGNDDGEFTFMCEADSQKLNISVLIPGWYSPLFTATSGPSHAHHSKHYVLANNSCRTLRLSYKPHVHDLRS